MTSQRQRSSKQVHHLPVRGRANMSNKLNFQYGALRELTAEEIAAVSGGTSKNAGGGPGNSGPGDKHSPVEGPPSKK
jgi:hypothetical protein